MKLLSIYLSYHAVGERGDDRWWFLFCASVCIVQLMPHSSPSRRCPRLSAHRVAGDGRHLKLSGLKLLFLNVLSLLLYRRTTGRNQTQVTAVRTGPYWFTLYPVKHRVETYSSCSDQGYPRTRSDRSSPPKGERPA